MFDPLFFGFTKRGLQNRLPVLLLFLMEGQLEKDKSIQAAVNSSSNEEDEFIELENGRLASDVSDLAKLASEAMLNEAMSEDIRRDEERKIKDLESLISFARQRKFAELATILREQEKAKRRIIDSMAFLTDLTNEDCPGLGTELQNIRIASADFVLLLARLCELCVD